MITKITIGNFRCIRGLELTLDPLTVLVGPNAAGKSSVLAALATRGFPPHEQTIGAQGGVIVRHYDSDPRTERLDVGRGSVAGVRARVHQFELGSMRQRNKVHHEDALSPNGGNLANAFASLPRREQAKIAAELAELVDVFGDVDVQPIGSGSHRMVFEDRWNAQSWLETSQVSDGTMIVLAFLVLQHEQTRPETICIEEPERGLHPYLLGKVIGLLREMSQGKHGAPTQFVLATQSADLLDHVQPHEVRFLERDSEGGVQVRLAPIDDEAWENAIETYENSVGQMWLSGSLGGVPG